MISLSHLSFTVNKMPEISIRAKHELMNDMMKRAKGEGIRDTANLNQMIFTKVKYEHMMGGSD